MYPPLKMMERKLIQLESKYLKKEFVQICLSDDNIQIY